MRYIIVGNANAADVGSLLTGDDFVIHINGCRHLQSKVDPGRAMVFVTNTGDPADDLAAFLLSDEMFFKLAGATVVLARSPRFYYRKKRILETLGVRQSRDFRPNVEIAGRIGSRYPTKTLNFGDSLRLEREFLKSGMPYDFMPSTGAIAVHWACSQMGPQDTLRCTGFTFDGWARHPWSIEERLVEPFLMVKT